MRTSPTLCGNIGRRRETRNFFAKPEPRSYLKRAGSGPAVPSCLHHIRGIIGPNEYHETVDDNAFTNVMARWNIHRATDIATLIHARWPACWVTLSRRLEIDDDEIKRWRDVSDAMATGLDVTTGLFEQFEGFFGLEPINLSTYEGRTVPMDVVLGRSRTARSQVVKQADVVALVALLPDEFAGESGSVNFRYYESRCAHGSSLSRAMQGLAAARLGYADEALAYFDQTSAIDLGDRHVAIAGGMHRAALGGVWQSRCSASPACRSFLKALIFDRNCRHRGAISASWSTGAAEASESISNGPDRSS